MLSKTGWWTVGRPGNKATLTLIMCQNILLTWFPGLHCLQYDGLGMSPSYMYRLTGREHHYSKPSSTLQGKAVFTVIQRRIFPLCVAVCLLYQILSSRNLPGQSLTGLCNHWLQDVLFHNVFHKELFLIKNVWVSECGRMIENTCKVREDSIHVMSCDVMWHIICALLMRIFATLLIHLPLSPKSSCLPLALQKTQHISLSHGTFHIADNGSTIVEKLHTNLETFHKPLLTMFPHCPWNSYYHNTNSLGKPTSHAASFQFAEINKTFQCNVCSWTLYLLAVH